LIIFDNSVSSLKFNQQIPLPSQRLGNPRFSGTHLGQGPSTQGQIPSFKTGQILGALRLGSTKITIKTGENLG